VSIQDKFLKPISTITTDKIKNPQQEQNMWKIACLAFYMESCGFTLLFIFMKQLKN
jgi:hypothetical protein